jgi:hypothetical protein
MVEERRQLREVSMHCTLNFFFLPSDWAHMKVSKRRKIWMLIHQVNTHQGAPTIERHKIANDI